MRITGFAALAATLLLATAATAQDDLPARRAAAHALMDPIMAAKLNELAPMLRRQLALPNIDAAEQEALYAAFDGGFPGMVREAQALAAEALAGEWSLAELNNPDALTGERMAALTTQIEPAMSTVGQGFAIRVLRAGCTVNRQPSVGCARTLETVRNAEAAR